MNKRARLEPKEFSYSCTKKLLIELKKLIERKEKGIFASREEKEHFEILGGLKSTYANFFYLADKTVKICRALVFQVFGRSDYIAFTDQNAVNAGNVTDIIRLVKETEIFLEKKKIKKR